MGTQNSNIDWGRKTLVRKLRMEKYCNQYRNHFQMGPWRRKLMTKIGCRKINARNVKKKFYTLTYNEENILKN